MVNMSKYLPTNPALNNYKITLYLERSAKHISIRVSGQDTKSSNAFEFSWRTVEDRPKQQITIDQYDMIVLWLTWFKYRCGLNEKDKSRIILPRSRSQINNTQHTLYVLKVWYEESLLGKDTPDIDIDYSYLWK